MVRLLIRARITSSPWSHFVDPEKTIGGKALQSLATMDTAEITELLGIFAKTSGIAIGCQIPVT